MLVSSRNLTLYRILFVWSLAFFLFKDPVTVYTNPLVIMLGAGVGAAQTYVKDTSALTTFVAALLVVSGTQDIGLLMLPDPLPAIHATSGVRSLALFGLSTLAYLDRLGLGLSVIFTYTFSDLMLSVWIYMATRDEENEQSKSIIRNERGRVETN